MEFIDNTKPSVEYRVVRQDDLKEFQCGICLSLLRTPMQCKNGHIFCEECIKRSLRSRTQCPTCRCLMNEKDLSRVLVVDRMLALLDIWCTYHFKRDEEGGWELDEEGCPTVCKHENMEAHERQCDYAWASCPYSKECKIRKKDLAEHKTICDYHPVECEFCHLDFQSKALSEHKAKCQAAPISCELCEERLRRADLTYHQQKQCLEQPLACPYGCNQKVLRKDLNSHLTENVIQHLEELRTSFSRSLQEAKDGYQQELKKQDKEIQRLKNKLKTKTDIKLLWIVKDWKQLCRKSNYAQSKKFEVDGISWYLGIYANSDTPESRGWVSLYLFLDSVLTNKTVHAQWRASIINTNPTLSIHRDHIITFPVLDGQGWGERKFFQTDIISNEKAGYLVNDSIRIEVDLIFRPYTFEL